MVQINQMRVYLFSGHSPSGGAREDPQVARRPEGNAGAEGRRGGEEARGAEGAGQEGARGLVQAARGDHHQDQVV